MTYYYIIEDGSVAATGSTRIDPSDTNSPYYIDGQYSEYWESAWIARLDSAVVGYPESGQHWDFVNNTWAVSKEFLKQSAKSHRINLEGNSTIFYQGYTVPVDISSLAVFSALAQKARLENPNEETGVSYDLNENSVTMTNAEFLGLCNAVFNHFQSIIDADISVIAQIEAGTITATSEIVASFDVAMANPYPHVNPITNLYTVINNNNDAIAALTTAIANKQTAIESAENIIAAVNGAVSNLETDVSVLKGLPDLEDAVVASNAAQNALADKYNDLADKFNTLLSHLEAQGLQAS